MFARVWLALGYAFRTPIVALVVYSFNDSPVANARGLHAALVRRPRFDRSPGSRFAQGRCDRVRASSSSARSLRRARPLSALLRQHALSGMVAAPLQMPEVIIGLSLLPMLVSLQRATGAAFGVGFPERGMLTIWLGHVLLGMAYATVVVRAWLQTLNPQLEEAALDLGARPWQVFAGDAADDRPGAARHSCSPSRFVDDVVLSAFSDRATTMPLVIFSRPARPQSEVNAAATIIIALVAWRRRGELRWRGTNAGAPTPPPRSRNRRRASGSPISLALAMAVVGAYVGFSKALLAVFPVFILAWLRLPSPRWR